VGQEEVCIWGQVAACIQVPGAGCTRGRLEAFIPAQVVACTLDLAVASIQVRQTRMVIAALGARASRAYWAGGGTKETVLVRRPD
jgi:tRNA A37 threonylcarbamoyladenosine modification protein TsaB